MQSTPVKLSQSSCVRANNLDVARSMLLDLEQQLVQSHGDSDDDDERELFTATLSYAKSTLQQLLAAMALNTARYSQPLIEVNRAVVISLCFGV